MPATVATHEVEVDGATIWVEVSGNGEPVVLLHGWPDSGRIWAPQVEALTSAGYRTIVPDMLGLGRSSKPAAIERYRMRELVTDVVGVLDAIDVPTAHVVGHDWGAVVAWSLAMAMPKRLSSLTAMSAGHPAAFLHAGLEQREKSWYMLLFQFEHIAEQWLCADDWANLRGWSGHPCLDVVITDMCRPGALTASLNLYRANSHPSRWVGRQRSWPPIEVPTMGIWSSHDTMVTKAQMRNSGAFVSASWRYERVEGGHWMHSEAPDALNALLLDFLQITHGG